MATKFGNFVAGVMIALTLGGPLYIGFRIYIATNEPPTFLAPSPKQANAQ